MNLQDVSDLKPANSAGFDISNGLSIQVKNACNEFFRSRGMTYGKELREEANKKSYAKQQARKNQKAQTANS